MERAVIVKGRVTDSRHIELDEPVDEIAGDVEVTVRPLHRAREEGATDIEAIVRIEDEWRAKHPDRLRRTAAFRRHVEPRIVYCGAVDKGRGWQRSRFVGHAP